MRYEHLSDPILPLTQWIQRTVRAAGLAVLVITVALSIGILGYHEIGHLSWIDSILEASMILGGMGAIAPMTGDAIKLFASFYALMSGLVVMSTMGIVLAPWLHRILHHLHARRD